MQTIPKILSPGGDVLSVKAAILAGADEVYLGVSEFNARRRADNITFEELEELVCIARQKGVQLFLTLNTLLTNDEFTKIVEVINQAVSAGISAFIVQDLGLLHILHNLLPDMDIHGSTQITTHNHGQIDFLADKGISRINLARELSIEDIASITGHAHGMDIETEVFVHGAYCISYSGQCYMSSFMGGKSGNRGICFQPCRRVYTSDGFSNPQFRLNLKDNNQLGNAEELSKAGVDSLKIEGRIKGFYYVFTVTDAWRNRLTSMHTNSDVKNVFNRGFHAGYAENHIGPEMFAPNGPADQSLEFVAEVGSFNAQRQILYTKTPADITENDQILIYTKENKFICTGIITGLISNKEFNFKIEHEIKDKILKNQIILKNTNYKKQEKLKKQIDLLVCEKQLITVSVSGTAGSPLRTVWKIGKKEAVSVSSVLLEKAKNAGITMETLKKQFSRLDSRFLEIGSINTGKLEDNLFLPVSELNTVRREAVRALFQQPANTVVCPELPEKIIKTAKPRGNFLFFINSAEDFKLLLKSGINTDSIIREVTNPDQYDSKLPSVPWFPAVIHEQFLSGYYSLMERVSSNIPVFTDNLAIANYARETGRQWVAGNRLNITNSFAVQSLKDSGAEGFVISNELNKTQIESVLQHSPLQSYYLLFGPVLMMETRQCLVRNDKRCRKSEKDSGCFTDCSFFSGMYDENKNRFFLEKRPYKENEIYNGSFLYTPEAVRDFKDYSTNFIVDLRRFGFFNPTETQFRSFIKGIIDKQTIKKTEFELQYTRGNYNRGLS